MDSGRKSAPNVLTLQRMCGRIYVIKGGSDARDAARYRWLRDEAISFPYDVEIASPWCVFGMNTAEAEINPIDGTKLDAAIDAARRFAEDNDPQATSAEVGS